MKNKWLQRRADKYRCFSYDLTLNHSSLPAEVKCKCLVAYDDLQFTLVITDPDALSALASLRLTNLDVNYSIKVWKLFKVYGSGGSYDFAFSYSCTVDKLTSISSRINKMEIVIKMHFKDKNDMSKYFPKEIT